MEGQVCAAVIGEIAGKAASKVINTLGKRPSVDEKLQRLEMLVIKLRGTVEMSERVGAETVSLLQWRDKLREAATKGHQVLVSFQRRADDTGAADEETTGHQGGGGSVLASLTRNTLLGMARGVRSATTALLSCGECAASFTKNTLQAMAKGFRSATTVMLSCGEGVVKLNNTVDRLEKTCADIGEFIRLLQVEASQAKPVHRPNKRKRTTSMKSGRESIENAGVAANAKKNKDNPQHEEDAVRLEDALPKEDRLFEEDAVAADEDALTDAVVVSRAVERIQDAFAEIISRVVAVADLSSLTNLELMAAELEDVLREDRQQGRAINCKANASKQEGDRLCSAVISEKEKQPGINEKLQRLEMLVVKLRSTVEVSERLGVLLQWRKKLSEAASMGHQVLLSLQRRVMGANAATTDATDRQGGGKLGAVSFTRKALLGTARGIESVTIESLFDGAVAMKLNSTVNRLEKVSVDDLGDFITLLQVEASLVNAVHISTKRDKSEFQTALERAENVDIAEDVRMGVSEDIERRTRKGEAATTIHWAVLRFQAALDAITKAEEMADGRDLKNMEWLATWAYILRDARKQGHAIVLRIHSNSKDGKQTKGGEHEAHQLCNALHIMENLALDVECFVSLVLLCPSVSAGLRRRS